MKNNAFLVALLSCIGCASITGSSTERLRVMASPPGATVQVDGESRGTAPVSVNISKYERSSVEVVAPGYQTGSCDTHMSPSGGYIAADVALCLFLFPIGCISFIDAGGAWNALEQPHCHVSLVPDSNRNVHAPPATAPGS